MSTLAESAATVNFDQALRQVAARYKAVYPEACARIEKALAICLTDGVTLCADGSARVDSQSYPGERYHVNGHCTCQDAITAPKGYCKHRFSKSLYRAAKKLCERHAQLNSYYATYYGPTEEPCPGVAEWQDAKQCWLFIPDDGTEPLYAAIQALALGGHIPTAQAQRAQDGDLVRKVCGY